MAILCWVIKIQLSITLDLSFLVDENLNNYKELHDWIEWSRIALVIINSLESTYKQDRRFECVTGSTASLEVATGSKKNSEPI